VPRCRLTIFIAAQATAERSEPAARQAALSGQGLQARTSDGASERPDNGQGQRYETIDLGQLHGLASMPALAGGEVSPRVAGRWFLALQ